VNENITSKTDLKSKVGALPELKRPVIGTAGGFLEHVNKASCRTE
jgi:hypothetical protein